MDELVGKFEKLVSSMKSMEKTMNDTRSQARLLLETIENGLPELDKEAQNKLHNLYTSITSSRTSLSSSAKTPSKSKLDDANLIENALTLASKVRRQSEPVIKKGVTVNLVPQSETPSPAPNVPSVPTISTPNPEQVKRRRSILKGHSLHQHLSVTKEASRENSASMEAPTLDGTKAEPGTNTDSNPAKKSDEPSETVQIPQIVVDSPAQSLGALNTTNSSTQSNQTKPNSNPTPIESNQPPPQFKFDPPSDKLPQQTNSLPPMPAEQPKSISDTEIRKEPSKIEPEQPKVPEGTKQNIGAPKPTTDTQKVVEPAKDSQHKEPEKSIAVISRGSDSKNLVHSAFFARLFNHKIFRGPEGVGNVAASASSSAFHLSQSQNEVLFHPRSLFVQVWNSFYSISLILVMVAIPLSIAWDKGLEEVLPAISIFNLLVIALDKLIQYNTGLIIQQKLEMGRAAIKSIHFKKGLWIISLLSAFPWVFIIDAATPAHSIGRVSARSVCVLQSMEVFVAAFGYQRTGYINEKMVHFFRVQGLNAALIDSIKIMIAMIFYWHFNACAVMILKFVHVSHATEDYLHETEWEQYSEMVFSAAGEMLANGWGSEVPETTTDRWFKVLNMMISATFLALYIGNISAYMIGLDSSGKKFNEILEEVNQYINYKGFGDNLRSRIMNYYQFKYSGAKFFDENRILSELNHPMRQYIALRECQDLIIRVPFFKDADKYFIAQVVMILKVHHYLAGDYVIEEGTYGDHMYFIASGTVEAIINGVARAKLSPGLFFGEIALLFGRLKRTASIRTVTNCVLYSLSRTDLNTILELNPHMAEKMKTVAAERLANDKKAKQNAQSNAPAKPDAK